MSRQTHRYRVCIQADAVDDLDRIYSFISEESPTRAKGFVRSLKKKILSLKKMPRRGSRVQLLEDDKHTGQIRFIKYQGYLIFYTAQQKEAIILLVTGPGQDWMRFLL